MHNVCNQAIGRASVLSMVLLCCEVILVGPLVLRFGEPRQHIIDIWQRRVQNSSYGSIPFQSTLQMHSRK